MPGFPRYSHMCLMVGDSECGTLSRSGWNISSLTSDTDAPVSSSTSMDIPSSVTGTSMAFAGPLLSRYSVYSRSLSSDCAEPSSSIRLICFCGFVLF